MKGPGTHAFPLRIWQGDAFRQHDLAETAFWSVLSGWLLFAIVLGGLLFVMHSEWVYLLYSLYVLAHLLTLLINEGLLGDYYLAGLPGLAGPYVGDVAIGFITGSNALFVRSLLLSRRYVPRWLFRLSWYALGFWVVWMLGYVGDSLLRPALVTPWPLLQIAKYGVHLLGAGVTMLLIGYGLRSKPNRGLAMTYLLAFVPLLGVAWFYYFTNFHNRHGLELAQTQVYALTILFEMLILLVGLSYRFKTYRDERERLLREQSQLALRTQLAERERLARDLHDHIGPDLVVLKLRLEVARDEAAEPAVDQALQRVIEQTDRIVADIRQVSHALMPTGLRQQGLVVNLADYIRQVNHTMSGLEINFTHELDTQLPESVQQTLLSAAKELISNALRHARATVIDVELYHENNSVVLTVSDDGRGYNPKHVNYQSGGIGLRNIRTVVNGLHGQMTVSAKPTGGMIHQVIIPA